MTKLEFVRLFKRVTGYSMMPEEDGEQFDDWVRRNCRWLEDQLLDTRRGIERMAKQVKHPSSACNQGEKK